MDALRRLQLGLSDVLMPQIGAAYERLQPFFPLAAKLVQYGSIPNDKMQGCPRLTD